MKFFKYSLVYIFFVTSFMSFSQQKIYLDENNKVIDFENYNIKCNSFLYKCNLKDSDTIQFYTMRQLYKFGKLNSLENNQVRLLVNRATKQNYNPNKTLIIYLKDTIVGLSYNKRIIQFHRKIMASHYPDKVYDSPNSKNSYDLMYNRFRNNYDLNQKKCKRQYAKYNIDVVYFYYRNFEYKNETKNFTFHKIPLPLKNFLFKNNNTGYVILKPDGSYFYYNSIKEKKLKELLKSNWKEYIDDYKWIKENLSVKIDKGFFKSIEYKYSSSFQCYSRTASGY